MNFPDDDLCNDRADDLVLRNIQKEDLPDIAKVHLNSFPDSALSQLGVGAVHRYYLWQLEGPHEIEAICAAMTGEIIGFCFGGIFRGSMEGYLTRNKHYLVWRVLSHPWLIWSPIIRKQINIALQTLKTRQDKENLSNEESFRSKEKLKKFSILSIAVTPVYQKRGIGSVLLDEVELRARNKNFSEMRLIVHPQNAKAVNFYESLGWLKCSSHSWTGLMTKILL